MITMKIDDVNVQNNVIFSYCPLDTGRHGSERFFPSCVDFFGLLGSFFPYLFCINLDLHYTLFSTSDLGRLWPLTFLFLILMYP